MNNKFKDETTMRLLFEIDTKDYDINGAAFIRHSARCIAIKNNKVAMIYSPVYNYYKFPGGGIEGGETNIEAMIREAREEAGLVVIPSSVKEFGCVHRIEKSHKVNVEYFLQDNFYYLCEVEDGIIEQDLDGYEAYERFTLVWISADEAIETNLFKDHGDKQFKMLEREARVLQILKDEGYLS